MIRTDANMIIIIQILIVMNQYIFIHCKFGYGQYFNYASDECILNNCLNCSTQNVCALCNSGYYIDESGQCIDCSSSINNCQNCSDSNNCTACNQGYYSDESNKSCINCIKNCQNCNNSVNCSICNSGYYIDESGQCIDCRSIKNCQNCSDSDNCTACNQGYYSFESNKKCMKCIQDCQNCNNPFYCNICNSGYYVGDYGKCIDCSSIKFCQTCSDNNSCTTCINGYYFNQQYEKCTNCIKNCQNCNNLINCSICNSGYYTDEFGQCNDCSGNCLICNNSTDCTICNSSYFVNPSSGQCSACVQNCLNCSDSQNCTECNSGFYLSQQQCVPCVKNCSICSNQSNCSVCDNGFEVDDQGNCFECIDGCETCQIIKTIQVCQQCDIGYYKYGEQRGKCKKCMLSNCLNCSSDIMCDECISGYYQSDEQCLQCGYNNPPYKCGSCIPNCQSCINNYNCQTCNTGYYTSESQQCYQCSDNCTLCQDESMCIQCNNFYYLKNNSCYPCPVNCYNCSISVICYTCDAGYYMNRQGICIRNLSFCQKPNSTNPNHETECDECISNYYKNDIQQCDECSNICNKYFHGCNITYDQCLDCKSLNKLYIFFPMIPNCEDHCQSNSNPSFFCLTSLIFSGLVALILLIVIYLAFKEGVKEIYEKIIINICIFDLFFAIDSFLQGLIIYITGNASSINYESKVNYLGNLINLNIYEVGYIESISYLLLPFSIIWIYCPIIWALFISYTVYQETHYNCISNDTFKLYQKTSFIIISIIWVIISNYFIIIFKGVQAIIFVKLSSQIIPIVIIWIISIASIVFPMIYFYIKVLIRLCSIGIGKVAQIYKLLAYPFVAIITQLPSLNKKISYTDWFILINIRQMMGLCDALLYGYRIYQTRRNRENFEIKEEMEMIKQMDEESENEIEDEEDDIEFS